MDLSAAASLQQDQGEGRSSRRYNSRAVIRRTVKRIIVRQLLMERAALRPNQHQRRPRLNEEEYRLVQEQTRLIEDIIYCRSSSLEEYQDLNTLRDRVLSNARAVYRNIQRSL